MKKTVMGFLMILGGLVMASGSTEEPDYVPPALTPAPYLIRDPAVRAELKVEDKQAGRLQALCDKIDEHLFALRDQPPIPSDPLALEHVRAVVKAMDTLPTILKPSQIGRLQELAIQFEGPMALFRREPADCVRLSAAQKERMRGIYRQSVRLQEELKRRLEESGESSSYAQQAEQIRVRLMQQFLMGLTEGQLVVWQGMLGREFDFSLTQPLSFRAPDLPEATRWIQTRPISIKGLQNRVVAIIFFSADNAQCEGDYAIYKLWTRQYDPKDVFVLGVHIPAGESEDKAAVDRAIEREGLNFPIAVDGKKTICQAWVNPVCPSVYLVDKTGRVRYWWYGPIRKNGAVADQWLSERIEQLRAETIGESDGKPLK